MAENPELAFQNLMFLRDVKKGKGRRKEFKLILSYLIENNMYTDIILSLVANSMRLQTLEELMIFIVF